MLMSVDLSFDKKLGERELSYRDSIQADKQPNVNKHVAAFVATFKKKSSPTKDT